MERGLLFPVISTHDISMSPLIARRFTWHAAYHGASYSAAFCLGCQDYTFCLVPSVFEAPSGKGGKPFCINVYTRCSLSIQIHGFLLFIPSGPHNLFLSSVASVVRLYQVRHISGTTELLLRCLHAIRAASKRRHIQALVGRKLFLHNVIFCFNSNTRVRVACVSPAGILKPVLNTARFAVPLPPAVPVYSFFCSFSYSFSYLNNFNFILL